mgnify:FL=1|tara:strand:- start:166 stop:348 length:183 start_codon:yes stop_codon:yes gene_type:complete
MTFEQEYVDSVNVDVAARTFELVGSDGSKQKIRCETPEEFMNVLKVTREAGDMLDIDYTG